MTSLANPTWVELLPQIPPLQRRLSACGVGLLICGSLAALVSMSVTHVVPALRRPAHVPLFHVQGIPTILFAWAPICVGVILCDTFRTMRRLTDVLAGSNAARDRRCGASCPAHVTDNTYCVA